MADAPTLVLVTGLPGTGKATVAEVAADLLGTAVIAHDSAMSRLRPHPAIQAALNDVEWGHRLVGWPILAALARAQLIENRSVVLDGVARAGQRDQCGAVVRDVGATFVVIPTECPDRAPRRSRIVGHQRSIPDWHELLWGDVEHAIAGWEQHRGDLNLDAAQPWPENEAALRRFLADR